MPTYAYRCTVCGHEFDKFQRVTDPRPPCPECSGEVKQVLTAGHKIGIKEPWRSSKERMS